MTRYIYLVLACMLMSTVAFSQSQSIQGRIYDAKTNEGLPFANVILLKDGIQKSGTTTDLDGNYSFAGFDPGVYDVEAVYVGYPNARITGVSVGASQSLPLDIEMSFEEGIDLNVVTVTGYVIPLIKVDETASGNTLGGEDIKKLPTRSVTTLIATTGGVSQDKEGENVSFRGAREGDQIIYVDGVRVRGRSVQAQDIEQIQVITGGVPAAFGDVTGGVTNIITKGAASKYNGSADVETSEGLDGFGYNFVTGSFSGPLWKKTVKGSNGAERVETILGFRISGQFTTVKEPSPSYLGSFRATPDFVSGLLTDPGLGLGNNVFNITENDIERLTARPNARDTDYSINGKLDFVPASGMSISLGGQYFNSKAKRAFDFYRLFNYDRNPNLDETDWRAYARFRHSIGGNQLDLSDEEREARTSALVQNINYTLQFDYSQNRDLTQDIIHEDNLFDYGYIGSVETGDVVYNYTPDAQGRQISSSYELPITSYTGGTVNPALEAFNQYDSNIIATNGTFISQYYPLGLYAAAGFPYNAFYKAEFNQIGINASAGFDIIGQKSKTPSKHSIQFGIYYEQRVDRAYSMGNGFGNGPTSLWEIARLQSDEGVAFPAIGSATDSTVTIGADGLTYVDLPLNNTNSAFGENIRNQLGLAQNAPFNSNTLTPDQLSLDLFSADELIGGTLGRLSFDYYGYDYTGNALGTDVTFEDFFTERDDSGNLTRPVAPSQPIYAAAYIQDKFSFKDLYFNMGLRIDRYDANQKVLADPFSLFATKTVGEATDLNLTHPANIQADGQDFVVYGNQESRTIDGYRDGEQWYDANGNAVNDPFVIFGGSQATPYLERENENIQIDGFDPNSSFIDYEPQLTFMPRISFSFPLSESSGFFAHYDVLSKRPTNSQTTALDFYYFTDRINLGNTLTNANLRPSKTIDYQVGFQQKLSESSALKISAYYREQRDEINTRQILYAWPLAYNTYGNRDFGTVKGFSFAYDLRRTNNLSIKANYTLQFADGTGSNANSTRNAAGVGDLRVFIPYDFDQRHNVAISLDYRYGEGSKYNGPTLFNKNILANTGLNLLINVGSGRPFTLKNDPTAAALAGSDGNARGGRGGALGGSFNGALLPWTNRIDLRLDRDVRLGKPDSPLYLNIYVRTQNLFNTENVVQVYAYTGSASDDGYLASPQGQGESEVYQMLYNLRAEKSAHYGLPRRIRVGASLSF